MPRVPSGGRLQLKRDDLAAALDGDLSARHLFVLGHIHAHTETLQAELAAIDANLLEAMQPYARSHAGKWPTAKTPAAAAAS